MFELVKALVADAEGDVWTQESRAMVSEKVTQDAYRDFAQESFFYAACFAIMSNGASAPWVWKRQTVDEDGKTVEEDVAHQLLDSLMERPNPYMTWYDLMESTYAYLELAGKAYWEIARDGDELALYPVRPDLLSPRGDSKKLITHYVFRDPSTGNEKTIKAETIVRFGYFHPTSATSGFGSAEPARLAADLIAKARTWNRRGFTDSSNVEGVLQSDQDLTPAEIKTVWQMWQNRHRGEAKSRLPAVLPKGLQWNPTGVTHKDMDFEKLIDIYREDELAAFGVPPIMVGWLKYVNYNTATAQERSFWVHTMEPKLTKVESGVSLWLLPILREMTGIDDLIGYYDRSQIPALQEDANEASKRVRGEFKDGVITRNEARQALGKDPIDGEDKFYDQIQGAAMFGGGVAVAEPDGEKAPQEPRAATPGLPDVPAQETALNGAQVVAALQIVERVVAGNLTPPMGAAMLRSFFNLSSAAANDILSGAGSAKPAEALTKALAAINRISTEKARKPRQQAVMDDAREKQKRKLFPRVAAFYKDLGDRFIERFEEMADKKSKAADAGPEFNWLQKSDAAAAAWAEIQEIVAVNDSEWLAKAEAMESIKKFEVDLDDLMESIGEDDAARLAAILSEMGISTIDVGAKTAVVGQLGKPLGDFAISEAIYRDFVEHSFAAAGGAVDTARKRMIETLAHGISDGDTTATIARSLREVQEGLSLGHSAMIAETESQGAMNYGALKGYEFAGIGKKEWLTSGSGNERQGHEMINGQVRDVDKPFDVPVYDSKGTLVAVEQLMYPGDYSGSFANTHRCECTMIPVVEE